MGKATKELNRLIKKRKVLNNEFYSLRSILGYSWAIFYFLLGGREAGKSYAVTEFFVRQWREYGRPFYWLRLSETSARKLLSNNAEKLIDPDIRRKYNIELKTKGDAVYEIIRHFDDDGKEISVEKKLMARVLSLATYYNDKGSGLFDKDFLDDPKMYYNICLDEMNREQNERKSFDIVYSFANQLENLVRSTKQRIRVICIGNTLEEASDLLCAFNFLPEEFGRYKLKNKRAVIDYIEPSEAYKRRRQGTVADILSGQSSTFTNEVKVDSSLVDKRRLIKPQYQIWFSETEKYTVWNNNIIAQYNNEKVPVISMRPYLSTVFNAESRNTVITTFDSRAYHFRNLMTFKKFKKALTALRPTK